MPRPALTAIRGVGDCYRGARSPLSIIISTQAPTDSDLLSILIDDALAGHDPHVVVKLYTAPTDLNPFAEETIRLANPAFDTFMNANEVLAMAHDAKRMPAREAEYRNLVLNQRIETKGLILPGQRMIAGTRNPPSNTVPFVARNGVMPPSGQVNTSAPLSVGGF